MASGQRSIRSLRGAKSSARSFSSALSRFSRNKPQRPTLPQNLKSKTDPDLSQWKNQPGLSEADNPSPFKGKPSPFAAAKTFKLSSYYEDDLRQGFYWEPRDREAKFIDMELMERAWGDFNIKKPYEDLLNEKDDKTDWYDGQLDMTIHLLGKLPEKQDLAAELRQSYESVTERPPLPLLEGHFDETGEGAKEVPEQLTPEQAEKKEQYKRNVDRFIDETIDKKEFIKVSMIDAEGTTHRIYGVVGESFLQIARRWDVPIDGMCMGGDPVELYGEGPMCHLCQMDFSPQYAHLLPKIRRQEEYHFPRFRTIAPTSRLGCQIKASKEMDGIVLHIPPMLAVATSHV